jgi:hypothetical protein
VCECVCVVSWPLDDHYTLVVRVVQVCSLAGSKHN